MPILEIVINLPSLFVFKMISRLFTVIIFTLLTQIELISQIDTTNLHNLFDNFLEEQSMDNEINDYYDQLEYLIQNPIRLNKASINELMAIPFLTRQEATAIIRHRNLLGGIYESSQLVNIVGVRNELITKILPFLQLGDYRESSPFDSLREYFNDIHFSFRTRISQELQTEMGFLNGAYSGSKAKISNRLIITRDKNLRLGLLTEKDAGENSFTDLALFNLFLKNNESTNSLVLGDYLVEFGQGLAIWNRYGVSKGSGAVNVLPRKAHRVKSFLSSEENLFMRGIAGTIKFSNLSFTSFFSYKNLDANIDTFSNQIISFPLDGMHRTKSELSKKDMVKETIFGIAAEYEVDDLGSLGFLFYNTGFDHALHITDSHSSPQHSFNIFSSSYNINYGSLSFTGETSLANSSIATINSIEIAASNNFAFLFSLRNYASDYRSFRSSAFGENSSTKNELGFYSGFRFYSTFGTFDLYYDQYKFPIADNRYNFSTKGNDFLIHYSYKPSRSIEVRLRYKNEIKEDIEPRMGFYSIYKKKYEGLRGEILFKSDKTLQLRTRGEFVTCEVEANKQETGFLIYQDIKVVPFTHFDLYARIILFGTDSYNSRVYQFENDLPGVLSNSPLYGEGTRWYIFFRYKTDYGFSISTKYSELKKPDNKIFGTGNSQFPGTLDNRLSFQIDYNF